MSADRASFTAPNAANKASAFMPATGLLEPCASLWWWGDGVVGSKGGLAASQT